MIVMTRTYLVHLMVGGDSFYFASSVQFCFLADFFDRKGQNCSMLEIFWRHSKVISKGLTTNISLDSSNSCESLAEKNM